MTLKTKYKKPFNTVTYPKHQTKNLRSYYFTESVYKGMFSISPFVNFFANQFCLVNL